MENHFNINVARANGANWNNTGPKYVHHFKAIVRDEGPAKIVFAELQAAFPSPEYQVTVSHWTASGKDMDW